MAAAKVKFSSYSPVSRKGNSDSTSQEENHESASGGANSNSVPEGSSDSASQKANNNSDSHKSNGDPVVQEEAIREFIPIVSLDTNQPVNDFKIVENFENKITSLSTLLDNPQQPLHSVKIYKEETTVRFNVKQGSSKGKEKNGKITVKATGVTVLSKTGIETGYGQTIELKISGNNISDNAYIDFYTNIHCGRVHIGELLKIKAKKADYTVVLDKSGQLFTGYDILEFEVEGPPNYYVDIQVTKKDASLFSDTFGITNSWDKTKLPKDRGSVKTFSSWTNGDTTLKLDASGKCTYKMPLEWWRDMARQKLSDFTTMKIHYKALVAAKPKDTPLKTKIFNVDIHNNLVSFAIRTGTNVYGRLSIGGPVVKYIKIDFTVKEANTTEMYCFVQWIKGGRKIWDASGNMTRSVTRGYDGNLHPSHYPTWTLDTGDRDPRYGPPTEGASFGSTKATLIDAPSATTPNAAKPHTYTYMYFNTEIYLNVDVPATLTGNDGITATIPTSKTLVLDNILWESKILQIWSPTTGITITHPATYLGP